MQNSKTNISPLRVTILSDSFIQRASLKNLLIDQGSEIVYENTLGGVDQSDLKIPTDVLLVDLESAGDLSLNNLESILDNNPVPVLFNDGSTIPTDSGPIRDDWINNLTHKLYSLANKELVKTTRPSVSSRISNEINKKKNFKKIPLKKEFPRVAVVSRSNTRRTVLKHILLQRGLKHVSALDYSVVNLDKLKMNTHILLIDQHNMRNSDYTVLDKVKSQNDLGYIICNSSKIPVTANERQQLGDKLLKKLTSKASKHSLNSHAAEPVALFESNSFIHKNPAPADKKPLNKASANATNTVSNSVSSTTSKDTKESLDNHAANNPSKDKTNTASLFKQDPAHWADRLSDALAGVRENLRSIDNGKISNLFRNKSTADNEPDKAPVTAVASKVVKLPVKNKNNQTEKKTNQANKENESKVATTTAQTSQPGILDIFNDMVKAVKEVPVEADISKDIYQREQTSKVTVSEYQSDNNTITSESVDSNVNSEINTDISLENNSVENFAANEMFNENTDKKSGFHSDFSNFQMDEDFTFNNEQDNDSELAFEMELRTLKDELEIFEDNYSSLRMPEGLAKEEKKRSILGLHWSNPFK